MRRAVVVRWRRSTERGVLNEGHVNRKPWPLYRMIEVVDRDDRNKQAIAVTAQSSATSELSYVGFYKTERTAKIETNRYHNGELPSGFVRVD